MLLPLKGRAKVSRRSATMTLRIDSHANHAASLTRFDNCSLKDMRGSIVNGKSQIVKSSES